MRSKRFLSSLALVVVVVTPALAQPKETPEQRDARMEWWREALAGGRIRTADLGL